MSKKHNIALYFLMSNNFTKKVQTTVPIYNYYYSSSIQENSDLDCMPTGRHFDVFEHGWIRPKMLPTGIDSIYVPILKSN